MHFLPKGAIIILDAYLDGDEWKPREATATWIWPSTKRVFKTRFDYNKRFVDNATLGDWRFL